jgi:tetratricopeptide (TPR) repeat protein
LQRDEQQVLGQIIDNIGSENPDLAEAIRFCAIPHRFNKEILAWLQGDGSGPSERTETILNELKLKKLVFDSAENLSLHDNVRNLLRSRWRRENPEDFKALNGKAATYYEYKLQQSVSSDDQRAEWERQQMYHLLAADQERGIDLFKHLCNKAIYSYRLSTLDLLFRIASEQVDVVGAGIQHWIKFFEAKKYQVSGDWDKAIEVWERLKEERAFFTGDLEPTLAVHLSILYKDKGEWNKAIASLDDSMKILEREGDEHGMITILNNRGFLYKDRADVPKAQNDFQNGLEISKKIGDESGKAISLKNLGLLHKDNGRVDEAVEHFQSSLSILDRIGDERGVATACDDRGLLYKDRALLFKERGDLQKAEDHFGRAEADFRRALEIFERIGNNHEKVAAFNSLGLFYKDRGVLYQDTEDVEKAEKNFGRALKVLEEIGDQRRKADTLNSLGFLYTAEMQWHDADANFQLALTNFQEALTILKEMHEERGSAVILSNLGLLYKHKGEQQLAVDSFQQSLHIFEKIGDEMNAATTMYELASLYDSIKQYDKAIELLEKVVKIIDRVGHPGLRVRGSREKLDLVKAKATLARASVTASDVRASAKISRKKAR